MRSYKYYLIGWEHGNHWKIPEFYISENDGILQSDCEIGIATDLQTCSEAASMRDHLSARYPDIRWYIVIEKP